jgi:hypothetical protein
MVFSYIFMLLPGIPAVDVRAQLAVMVFLIPLLLDLVVTWFILGLAKTGIHLVDTSAFLLLATVAVHSLILHTLTLYAIFALTAGALWMLVRLIWKLCHMKKPAESVVLHDLARDICGFFFSGLGIPGFDSKIEYCELNDRIQRYSSVAAVAPVRPDKLSAIVQILVALGLLVLTLMCQGVIPGFSVPYVLKMVIPFVSMPVAVFLLASLALELGERGRRFKLRALQFLTHTGLRLLLLALDLLYIPILTLLVSCLIPERASICPAGSYAF